MIVRIVQMTFQPENIPSFLGLFEERKMMIRNFEGCKHLELWQDAHANNVFFTYSIWESEQHLDHYRFSELFKDTWARTKALFGEKAKAWSVNQKIILD
ncbi:putative quinol monooxygenase [Polluticoccus soli]|uniref:putative quinol monooxygenase n=1 Tax=Polluticoccus soli TaxID=3034150 RepID=UPI0023E20B30|nr:antibiotic biosynthesis monooxygenase family protein [Flavipsychrobacter sp. JY13-12]